MRSHVSQPILLAFALVVVAPALAAAASHSRGHWGEVQALRVQLGEFDLRGDSDYWFDKELDFSGEPEDLNDAVVGIEYLRFLGDRLGFVAGGTVYSGSTEQFYLDFVDDAGFDIFHSTELEIASLNLGLLVHLARRDRAIVPYVGIGGGLYSWRLTESGDFIDFGLAEPEVFFDTFEDDGTTLGWYWQAGLEVPLGRNLSVYGDARWVRAEADLEGDFAGLGDLDLSGKTLSAGLTWSF